MPMTQKGRAVPPRRQRMFRNPSGVSGGGLWIVGLAALVTAAVAWGVACRSGGSRRAADRPADATTAGITVPSRESSAGPEDEADPETPAARRMGESPDAPPPEDDPAPSVAEKEPAVPEDEPVAAAAAPTAPTAARKVRPPAPKSAAKPSRKPSVGADWPSQGFPGVIRGIDVSHHNGKLDWAAIAGEQVRFAFAKATEYVDFEDSRYRENLQGMKAAGIVPGAYHFLMRTQGAAQAEWFVKHVRNDGPLMLALDYESATWGTKTPKPGDLDDFVKRFRELLPGRTLFLYTSSAFWRGKGNLRRPDGTTLWHANWVGGLPIPAGDRRWDPGFGGWKEAAFVQFGHAAVTGKKLDGNAFRGTLEELRALAK